jgi:hypothetical protein
MLTRENAQEQLKHFEIKDLKAFYKERLETLPPTLRNIAEPLLKAAGIHGSTQQDWNKSLEYAKPLEHLSAEERTKIFTAFFPKLAAQEKLVISNGLQPPLVSCA